MIQVWKNYSWRAAQTAAAVNVAVGFAVVPVLPAVWHPWRRCCHKPEPPGRGVWAENHGRYVCAGVQAVGLCEWCVSCTASVLTCLVDWCVSILAVS